MDSITAFFSENPVALSTRRLYLMVIERFLNICEPSICTAGDVENFLIATGWGSSLRYTAAVAIKRFLRWKFGADHPALRLRVKRGVSKPGRTLKAARVKVLLESFNTGSRKGKRDLAICCLALDTGLRVSELASIKLAALDLEEHKLVVLIKGGKWAEAVFSDYTGVLIAGWIPLRVGGDDRLFQVSRDGLRVIVRRWGEKLGFTLSPHDLRRTFCVLSLQGGAPSRLVQKAGRWSSIEMVERYSQAIEAKDFAPYFPVPRVIDF